MIKIGVPGITGRMGSAVAQQALATTDMQLSVVAARPGNPLVGAKFANTDLIVNDTIQGHKFDVLIDFTLPAGVMEHLRYCQEHNIAMVTGTTGLSDADQKAICLAATKIPIVLGANMSIGVNIYFNIIANAAKLMSKAWDISVSDKHHQHKKDSPSGTAKKMTQILSEVIEPRVKDIEVTSIREGETIGEHSVVFDNGSEVIEISHVAHTRDIYAQGAIIAARWVYGKQPGLYSMQDVITTLNVQHC